MNDSFGERCSKEVLVRPIPAAPGYYAFTPNHEEEYGSAWGETPEVARRRQIEWMEFVDEGGVE